MTPTCRYGHGVLAEVPVPTMTDEHGHPLNGERRWSFGSVSISRIPGLDVEFTNHGSALFTVMLFRCETCGYMEMIDTPMTQGGVSDRP